MQFMVTIYSNEAALAAIEGTGKEEFEQAHKSVIAELRASGELVDSNELSDIDARVVRTAGGQLAVIDGPFSESKEWVGGYYLLDCDSMDRAIEIASRFTEAQYAPVEVRRVGSD